MNATDILGTVGFLFVFHLLGGAALGRAARAIILDRQGIRSQGFWLLWGFMFGGLPMLAAAGDPAILPFQLSIFVGSGLIAFFFWTQIRELAERPGLIAMVVGGVFFVVGCAMFALRIKQNEYLTALVLGVFLGGAGVFLLQHGWRRLANGAIDSEKD